MSKQKFTAPLYDGDTIESHGFTFTVSTERDDTHGAPWDEEDGHGSVTDWTTRDKQPGELILASDRSRKRFYDYAGACRTACKDQWGSLWPYEMRLDRTRNGSWIARGIRYGRNDIASKPRRNINRAIAELYDIRRAQFPSARAYHANAAMADYDRLRQWCNEQWGYVGVIVTASRNDIDLASASLWGIESDAGQYLADVANDLVSEALDGARATIAALNRSN